MTIAKNTCARLYHVPDQRTGKDWWNMKRKDVEQTHFDQEAQEKSKEGMFYDTPFLQNLLEYLHTYSIARIGDSHDKKLLFYGCGTSFRTARELAERRAKVYPIDISTKSVERLYCETKKRQLSNQVFPTAMDCEELGFGNNTFDIVYGRAILHHLNLNQALKEIQRVLKPGGLAVFLEPLGMNPLINLYRKLTPNRRTPYERPLNSKDFKIIGSAGFSAFNHNEFTLVCNFGIFLNSVIKLPERLSLSYNILKKVDDFVLRKLPYLRKFCWNTVLVFTK